MPNQKPTDDPTGALAARRTAGEVSIPQDVIADFLKRIARDALPRISRKIIRAFYLDDDLLTILDERVISNFGSVAPHAEITNACEVRFADLSTRTFDSLERCMRDAAASRDPERLIVLWSCFSARTGALHEVELICTTEQALEPDRFLGPTPEAASIRLTVRGRDRDWNERVFAETLELIVANTSIPRHFRPLTIFGRRIVVEAMAHALAIIVWLNGYALLLSSDAQDAELQKNILDHTTLDERFEEFVRAIFRPDGGFTSIFIRLTVPLVLYLATNFVASRSLPRLFPRSSIGLGLAIKRREDADNYRSLIIFGVLVALVVGVMGNFVFQALAG